LIDIKNKTKDSADAYIYDVISAFDLMGGVSCKGFKKQVEELGSIKHLNLFINSPGGDVFEGLAIANYLKRQTFDIDVYIDGIAASIASAIALGCGGKVHMYESSIIMIHKAYCSTTGNSEELRRVAEQLEEVDNSIFSMYKEKIEGKLSDDELKALIAAESWLDASQCLDIGFAFDIIQSENKIAAKIPKELCAQFSNIPQALISDDPPTTKAEDEVPEDIKNIIARAELVLAHNFY
jgi:ATP-dependent Clp protease protease subunit